MKWWKEWYWLVGLFLFGLLTALAFSLAWKGLGLPKPEAAMLGYPLLMLSEGLVIAFFPRRARLTQLSQLWESEKLLEKLRSLESTQDEAAAAISGPTGNWRAVWLQEGPSSAWHVFRPELLKDPDPRMSAIDRLPSKNPLKWQPYAGDNLGGGLILCIIACLVSFAVSGLWPLVSWFISGLVWAGALKVVVRSLGQIFHGVHSGAWITWEGDQISSSDWSQREAICLTQPGLQMEICGRGRLERVELRQGRLELEIPCWSPGYPALKAAALAAAGKEEVSGAQGPAR